MQAIARYRFAQPVVSARKMKKVQRRWQLISANSMLENWDTMVQEMKEQAWAKLKSHVREDKQNFIEKQVCIEQLLATLTQEHAGLKKEAWSRLTHITRLKQRLIRQIWSTAVHHKLRHAWDILVQHSVIMTASADTLTP